MLLGYRQTQRQQGYLHQQGDPRELERLGQALDGGVVRFAERLKPVRQSAVHLFFVVANLVRELEKVGCIEVIGEVKRRGAMEHIFRGRARAFFSDEEWAELSPRERCLISRTMYQGLAARVEGAIMDHTFDSRDDRHLTWDRLEAG